MSLPESTKILIVGAGPTGLATALSLLHHNCHDFVIVDAVQEGENTSRAIIVHAATLEALDTIDCADDIISQGTRTTRLLFGTRSQTLIYPCMTYLARYTRHPYALIVPQCLTERALLNKFESLGGVVRRGVNVVEVRRCSRPCAREEAEEVEWMEVVVEDGRVIKAQYVVGADGARSVVRTSAGIDFKDPFNADTQQQPEQTTSLAQMILADVTFEGPLTPPTDMPFSGTMSPFGFFLCVALPPSCHAYLLRAPGRPATTSESALASERDQLYRIGCGIPTDEGEAPREPSKEYLQGCVDRYGPYRLASDPKVNPSGRAVKIRDVVWSTRFRNQAAIAERAFTRLGGVRRERVGVEGEGEGEGTEGQAREAVEAAAKQPERKQDPKGGIILLVGDAAHIHSPAGGQGMNLGLRDAIFLGEALTQHIETASTKSLTEADTILREFAERRHKRALEVIGLTKRILSVAGMKYREKLYWWLPVSSATMRDWAVWIAGSIPFVRRKLAWEISGLGRR